MKKPITLNPALKELQVLAGDWDMELSGASFLPSPDDKVHGKATFEWIENGAFFAMRQGEAATWVIGRDESGKDYKALYSDDRGVSRIYEMSFKDGVLKIRRDTPEFSQRFEGKLSEDGTTVTAAWEKSFDGQAWEHDFNLVYTKIK